MSCGHDILWRANAAPRVVEFVERQHLRRRRNWHGSPWGIPAACGTAFRGWLVAPHLGTVHLRWLLTTLPPSEPVDGPRRCWAVVPLGAAVGDRGAPSFSQCQSLPGVTCRSELGGAGRKPQPTFVGADDGDTLRWRNLCWKRH